MGATAAAPAASSPWGGFRSPAAPRPSRCETTCGWWSERLRRCARRPRWLPRWLRGVAEHTLEVSIFGVLMPLVLTAAAVRDVDLKWQASDST